MKLIKSAIVAVSLAFSLGTFSTSAVACEDGRACFGPLEGINMVLGDIAGAMKAIEAMDDEKVVISYIKAAKSSSKEINANDKVDRNRMRANGHLKKAQSAMKKGKRQEAEDHLKEAEKGFDGLKKLL